MCFCVFHFGRARESAKKINFLYVKLRFKKGYIRVIVFDVEKYLLTSVRSNTCAFLKKKIFFYAAIAAEHVFDY